MNGQDATLWTIDELGERVTGALEEAGYAGVASGRVRDVPDLRTIRYYTTLGLLDRPAGYRGRTALYGPRHLRQIVAIKTLQAEGLTLAEVQSRVAGATDSALASVAGVAPTPQPAVEPVPVVREPPGRRESHAFDRRSGAFWRETPRESASEPATQQAGEWVGAVPMEAVRLGPGGEATLLLATRRPLDDDDLRVIRLAAAPLIELMRHRGLIGNGAPGRDHQSNGEKS